MTTLTLTRDQLAALNPCDAEAHLALFGRRKRMTARQALDAGASVEDLLWVLGALGRKDLLVRFALGCAQRVAHHNADPRVQGALDATQAWLDDPSEENRRSAESAAWSAAAAWSAGAAAAAESAAAAAEAERDAQRALLLEIIEGG